MVQMSSKKHSNLIFHFLFGLLILFLHFDQRKSFDHYLNKIMPDNRIDFWNLTTKIIFLSQTTTGILANFFFLSYYLVNYRDYSIKPTHLIYIHLMSANTLVILSKGVPYTLAVFGLKQFLNDFECRIILYIERLGRSVSIGTICLLSVFQATTISQKEFCCKDQKVKATNSFARSIALLWIFYIVINFIFFVYPIIKMNNKNITGKKDFEYCSIVSHNDINNLLYTALVVCPEIFFSVVMAYSSGSMIVILYRHKQRVQHIHSTHGSSRLSHESRATKNILMLVSTFLSFYTVSSILQGCVAFFHNQYWLVNFNSLTSLCFPCFGPLFLMNYHPVVPRIKLRWIRNNNHLFLF